MSRLLAVGVCDGQQVSLVGGWDPPMRTAFLDVTRQGEEEPFFDSMMVRFQEQLTAKDVQLLAMELGVEVSEHFWDRLEEHVALRISSHTERI